MLFLKSMSIYLSNTLESCCFLPPATFTFGGFFSCLHLLNEVIKNLKDDKNNIDVFDSYAILADKNDSLSPEDTLDGVHLTINAYNKLKEKIKNVL